MPINDGAFPFEVQYALFIHGVLPERWDGMSGSYLGKDWSALGDILEIHKIDARKEVVFFLKYIDVFHANKINEDLDKKRKAEENKTQALGSNQGIHVQG